MLLLSICRYGITAHWMDFILANSFGARKICRKLVHSCLTQMAILKFKLNTHLSLQHILSSSPSPPPFPCQMVMIRVSDDDDGKYTVYTQHPICGLFSAKNAASSMATATAYTTIYLSCKNFASSSCPQSHLKRFLFFIFFLSNFHFYSTFVHYVFSLFRLNSFI